MISTYFLKNITLNNIIPEHTSIHYSKTVKSMNVYMFSKNNDEISIYSKEFVAFHSVNSGPVARITKSKHACTYAQSFHRVQHDLMILSES